MTKKQSLETNPQNPKAQKPSHKIQKLRNQPTKSKSSETNSQSPKKLRDPLTKSQKLIRNQLSTKFPKAHQKPTKHKFTKSSETKPTHKIPKAPQKPTEHQSPKSSEEITKLSLSKTNKQTSMHVFFCLTCKSSFSQNLEGRRTPLLPVVKVFLAT